MGHGHFSPDATTGRWKEISDYRGNHADVKQHEDEFIARENNRHTTKTITELFTNKYAFRKRDKWISDHEKLLAETRHGAQLRQIYHPSGTTVYYYIVVEKDIHEPNSHNLALKHMQGYYEELQQAMANMYGNLYEKTSAWTSQEIEVDA